RQHGAGAAGRGRGDPHRPGLNRRIAPDQGRMSPRTAAWSACRTAPQRRMRPPGWTFCPCVRLGPWGASLEKCPERARPAGFHPPAPTASDVTLSMNPVIRWFHLLGSPPYFDRFAARWAPWFWAAALLTLGVGAWLALFHVPADYQQGDSARILYIHVPSAWMSMFVFALMALYAAIALVWRIKLCEILAMACAPIGAGFTVITLATGSIWGKPMWGTWWDWDPRLTTELILLFLYLGVIGLYHAGDDRRASARAAGLLAIVGVALLPVIRYSVEWWDSLH